MSYKIVGIFSTQSGKTDCRKSSAHTKKEINRCFEELRELIQSHGGGMSFQLLKSGDITIHSISSTGKATILIGQEKESNLDAAKFLLGIKREKAQLSLL